MTPAQAASARRRHSPSPQELEMLRLASQSRPNSAIAEVMETTEQVVKNRFSQLFVRIGVGDRAGAVAKALREGWIK